MDLNDYSEKDLLKSIEAEMAKALNEMRCAQGDLDKVNSRVRFALAALHTIKDKKD